MNQAELLKHIWEELKELRTDFKDAAESRRTWEAEIGMKVHGLELDHQQRTRWGTAIAGILFACGMTVAGWVMTIQLSIQHLQEITQKKP